MKNLPVLFLLFALCGCVGYQINHYTPTVSAADQARPQYAADLSACREQVKAEQNPGEAAGKALIPVYGLYETFSATDPSTFWGARKAISDCMRAKGYGA